MTTNKSLELIPVGGPNPEDVLVLENGDLITGLEDGQILRISAETEINTIANTGGRPLGIDMLADGRLLVCDAEKGLLAINMDDGQIETLIARGDASLQLCNNPAIANDGRIYFSDSTQRYSVFDARTDVAEARGTGRLLCRYPDGRIEVLLDGLLFANGVALAADESFVLVAETGRACINRLWLRGDRAGQRDYLAKDMAELPDNINVGSDGLFWVALVGAYSAELKLIQSLPYFLRYLIARLPEKLIPAQPQLCRVSAYDNDGNLVHDITADGTLFDTVTGVREHNGTLYIGSINNTSIAKITL